MTAAYGRFNSERLVSSFSWFPLFSAARIEAPLPQRIFAHGWWMNQGQKMSKSLGNYVSREEITNVCEKYSVDVYRHYLLRATRFGADANFSHELFRQTYNDELANGVGNLLSRTVNMVQRYFGGIIPEAQEATNAEEPVIQAAADLCATAHQAMEACAFELYLEKLCSLTTATNRYIEATQPFNLAKDESQRAELGTILYTCAEAVRLIPLYLRPIMPKTSNQGLAALGVSEQDGKLIESGKWGGLRAGTKTEVCKPLFPRQRS